MQKNVAGQKWYVFAFDRTDNTPVTGDAANITAKISIDGAAADALTDVNPVEIESGVYVFDLTQAETNGNQLMIIPVSATADVQVIGALASYCTTISDVTLSGTASAGSLTSITLTGGTATDKYYNGQLVKINAGTGAGQSRRILSYVGSTAIATVTRDFAIAPDATSIFSVHAGDYPAILEAGTAQDGASSSITLDASLTEPTGTFRWNFIMITAGTGAGQTRLISNYNGNTKIATVLPAWTTAPETGSVYQIIPNGLVNVGSVNGTEQTEGDIVALITALNDLDSSDIQTACDTAITANTDINNIDTGVNNIETVTNKLDDTLELDGAEYRFTKNALEEAPSGSGGGLEGSNICTLTIHDEDGNNVVDAAVEIWDTAGTTFYERRMTNASGQTVHNLDDGTWTVKIIKSAYTFTNQTLIVNATEAETYTGTAWVVPDPADPDVIRIYEYCNKPSDVPVDSITANATIISLPYDYNGKVYSGEVYAGTYDTATGLVYWDIIKGAKTKFQALAFGINVVKTIPIIGTTLRLSDMT